MKYTLRFEDFVSKYGVDRKNTSDSILQEKEKCRKEAAYMKRPIIGVTCNYDYRDTVGMTSGMGITGQDWNFVAGDYIYILEKAGALPILLPIYKNCEDSDWKEYLGTLDGILISGGHDVGPEHYGQSAKGYCGTIIPERDRQDLEIARYAMYEAKKPVLGICRGIQIMNVAAGGTLYQDLEIEGKYEHHFGDKYPRNYPWQCMKLAEGSILESIYGKSEVWVNSFHHQAVREPGKGFEVIATSQDGVIEAIVQEDHPFSVGVQWHPEMMYDSAEQQLLLNAFVDACRG